MEPESSLHCTQEPGTCPCPEPQLSPRLCETFRKLLNFYGEELSSLFQTPSWGTTPCRLSVTIIIFAVSFHIWRPSVLSVDYQSFCFGLVPNAGNFLRSVFFFVVYLTFLPTYWSVGTVLYAARVRAFGFALLTHTSTHVILAVKTF
jgi:hypothetical protein